MDRTPIRDATGAGPGGARPSSALAIIGVGLARTGEKRVPVVEPGKVIRGAWQGEAALRSVIEREKIKTIVTLTAINRDDPKYVEQDGWSARRASTGCSVPMRGSTATPEQMEQAADLLADPARQPVFFHCVAGHHRSNLAHAAYLIRHEGMSAAAGLGRGLATPLDPAGRRAGPR